MNHVIEAGLDDLARLGAIPEPSAAALGYTPEVARSFPNDELYFILKHIGSNTLGPLNGEAPRTPIGELAVSFQSLINARTSPMFRFNATTCEAAEPRFIKSLAYCKGKTPHDTTAFVYTDDDGRPVAFRKNTGDRSTIVLRPHGVLGDIPAGTIVSLPLSAPHLHQPVPANPAVSTLPLERDYLRIRILRPSTFNLPPEDVAATGYMPQLYTGLDESGTSFNSLALTYDIAAVRAEVDELLSVA